MEQRKFHRFLVFALCWSMGTASAAPMTGMEILKESTQFQPSSVYVYGDSSLDLLIPVRVLGAVTKAGIHHVPPNTDLVTLISLAGGTLETANLEEVTIKRKAGDQFEVYTVNLETVVRDADTQALVLEAEDMVLVPPKKKGISDNLLRTVTLISGLATIFGTVVLGISNL